MAIGELVLGEDDEEEEEEEEEEPTQVVEAPEPSVKGKGPAGDPGRPGNRGADRRQGPSLKALLSQSEALRRHKKAVKRSAVGLTEWVKGVERETERRVAVDESLGGIHAMARRALGDLQGARDAMKKCSSLINPGRR